MRIGLSVSVIQRGRSGVATYVSGLLRGMEANGWPVQVVLFGLEADREWFSPWLGNCEWVGVDESFRPAVRNILWHQTALRPALKKFGCELVHIPSYRRLVAFPGVPQVATIHDCAPFRLAGKYDPLRMFYGRSVVRPMARRCEGVIAVSEYTAADIRQFFGVVGERLRVVWNGIDHARFRRMSSEGIRSRLSATVGWKEPWWIYVARLEHPAKNHVRLIQAFEGLCASGGAGIGRLVLAGADWHGAEVIHAAVEASSARDRIHLAGFVADEDLPAWYSGARALVFPSLFEGFGLPPVEAMACGCPVLSSDRGALGEVIGNAAKRFDPESVDSIAGAMKELMADPGLGEGLKEAGLRRADQFRWERCAAETVDVYRAARDRIKSLPSAGGVA